MLWLQRTTWKRIRLLTRCVTYILTNHDCLHAGSLLLFSFVVGGVAGNFARYFCILSCVKDESAETAEISLMASDACTRRSMRVASDPAGWTRRDSYIVWSLGAGRRCT